jgi:hypothetical protein
MPTAPGYVFALAEEGHDLEVFLWARDRRGAKAGFAALKTLRVSAG